MRQVQIFAASKKRLYKCNELHSKLHSKERTVVQGKSNMEHGYSQVAFPWTLNTKLHNIRGSGMDTSSNGRYHENHALKLLIYRNNEEVKLRQDTCDDKIASYFGKTYLETALESVRANRAIFISSGNVRSGYLSSDMSRVWYDSTISKTIHFRSDYYIGVYKVPYPY